MKKRFSNLSKDQLQRFIFLGVLVLVFSVFFIALGISSSDKKHDDNIVNPGDDGNTNPDKDNGQVLPDNNGNNENQVKPQTFILPNTSKDYKVVRKYYSTQSSTEDQEMSVIQYGKRYFVSTGVALENNDGKDFDVVASLDGVVESVENSPIYGVVIVIKHQENVLTEYSSLSQAKVSVGDNVKQGDVIGVSGTCEFDADLASHVYFKVSKNSQTYDPLTLIGLDLGQIQ